MIVGERLRQIRDRGNSHRVTSNTAPACALLSSSYAVGRDLHFVDPTEGEE
jgi:hypothetical protein